MASKSFLVLVLIVFCVSRILPMKGQDLSEHSDAKYNFELGSLSAGDQQSNMSAGNYTTRGYLIGDASNVYTHVAGYQSQGAFGDTWWHGVRANIDLWKQDLGPLSRSAIYIAAINDYNGVEMIAAGVHVYPQLYNNSDVRFFTYWKTTKDTGCNNTCCPGFVVADGANLFPGEALVPESTYDGERRYITLRIKKDEKTGDWSLYREDQGGPIGGMTLLGWWPNSLFASLYDRANIIQWAGEVDYPYNETGPSMGSGHSAMEGKGKAAAFYDCFGFDYDGTIYRDSLAPIPLVDLPECYDVSPWYKSCCKPDYQHFTYGGQAGCSV